MINIVSSRKIYHNTSWQIIYDWEDEFCEDGEVAIKNVASTKKALIDRLHFHNAIFPFIPKICKEEYNLFYTMVAPYEFNFFSFPNYIPIIIDAWKPDLWRIEKFCRYNKYIFLGCLEAVYELNKKGKKNVCYSPVSISKKYRCAKYPSKDIDLFVYGRNHEIIWDWIKKLFKSQLHIVTCYPNNKNTFIATSNKKGTLGIADTREDLMLLLNRSKYSAVSSTGNDKRNGINLEFTGGFSPVTPRFLECTVNYCQGVGIWYSNPDFDHFQIDKIAIKTETYDQFEEAINKQVEPNDLKDLFDTFLEKHWTSNRLKDILSTIEE